MSYQRNKSNHHFFNDESVKGLLVERLCISTGDSKDYSDLSHLDEAKETLMKGHQIFLNQRAQAYKRLEEDQVATVYMDKKIDHSEPI